MKLSTELQIGKAGEHLVCYDFKEVGKTKYVIGKFKAIYGYKGKQYSLYLNFDLTMEWDGDKKAKTVDESLGIVL